MVKHGNGLALQVNRQITAVTLAGDQCGFVIGIGMTEHYVRRLRLELIGRPDKIHFSFSDRV
ncbi:hypothetical protein D3C85_1410820 [compost metagenome]